MFYGNIIWRNENSREFNVLQTHCWFDRKKYNYILCISFVLLWRVVNPFKFSLENFETKMAQAVKESNCFGKLLQFVKHIAIRVVAATCDGASANRVRLGIRQNQELNAYPDVICRTIIFMWI